MFYVVVDMCFYYFPWSSSGNTLCRLPLLLVYTFIFLLDVFIVEMCKVTTIFWATIL